MELKFTDVIRNSYQAHLAEGFMFFTLMSVLKYLL